MLPMPDGVEDGICKGIYKLRKPKNGKPTAQLFGSGAILNESLRAQTILTEKYGISVNVWSVTSYNELIKDAVEVERWNLLHPDKPKKSYITEILSNEQGPVIAASDYSKSLPIQLGPWIKNGITALGTNGWGRSDTREMLRDYFEVSAEYIVFATLSRLSTTIGFSSEQLIQAADDLGINRDKANPVNPDEMIS